MYNVRLGAGVLSTAISVVAGAPSADAGAVEVEAAVTAVVSSAGGACVMTTSIVSLLSSLCDVCV